LHDTEPTFGDGRYIVRRELGRGTMGVVYEAEDPVLARTVAVKTIDLTFAAGERARADFERRFFTEARVAAQLSHPGIVVCHDVGKDAASGRLFIVFEHLKGRTLADLEAEGAMEWHDALRIVAQVGRAIHHAHEHGVVHRDLKPANIMLLEPGTSGAPAGVRAGATVKIMDFGVARLESLGPRITRTGQAFGSPLYMSPEQALGHASSARSDIFSLGSILCTLLLGRPWFEAPSLPKIVDRVVNHPAPRVSKVRPGLPAALDDAVAKALAKREADRYASASDMADDLEDVLAGRNPRHAARGSGRASEDALLAGLTAPASSRRGLPAHDPLASLLDEPAPASRAAPGPPAPATATMPIGAVGTVVTTASRRWWMPVSVLVGVVVIAAAVFVSLRAPAPVPSPSPSASVVAPAPPVTVAEAPPVPTTPTTMPEPAIVEPTPPPPSTTLAPVRPSQAPRPAPTAAAPVVPPPTQAPAVAESAATSMPEASEEAAPAPSSGSRIRLSVAHPFEDARLIVWVDGVLVHDAKLQASASRRIVAFKVREGHSEKMLEVEPGPHEVRVEVTWPQGRTARTKVVDVAANATGLLEAKVGRMSKDLSLTWSRLAKD
jgi:serine/threonine-protein kinase